MSQQSRRRAGHRTASRTAPISVIIALLATIALVIGLGSTTAGGVESGSVTFDEPVESIDDEAHVPVRYMSEDASESDDDLSGVLDELDAINADLDNLNELNSNPAEDEQPQQEEAQPEQGFGEVVTELDDALAGLDGLIQGDLGPEQTDLGISPLAQGPDGNGLATPYVYWRAVDQDGALVGGATFELEGPRQSNNNWTGSSDIVDNVGQSRYIGLDLDPDPGEFAVMNRGNHRLSTGYRYRVRSSAATAGSYVISSSWQELSGTNNTPSRNAWSGNRYNFGNFSFGRAAGHTIKVNKADLRTGLGASEVSASYTVGARFGLYGSETSTTIIDTCEIINSTEGCLFTDVPGGAVYWVQEMDPASGSPADVNYSENFVRLSTGSGASFTSREYRYPTETLASRGNNRTYTVPFNENTSDWRQTSGHFTNRIKNPPLQQTCTAGVDVALVMDLSGSVAPFRDNFRDAAKGFVNALHTDDGSNSVALFSFGNASPRADTGNYPIALGVDNAGQNALNNRIDNYWNKMATGEGTNWDAGLWQASQSANSYDIVLVLTDGNPTYSGNPRSGTGSLTTFREIERAVLSANVIKDAGTRVVSIGIGGNLSNDNLAAISGPQGASSGLSLNDIDYTTAGWSELSQLLTDFARGLSCQAGVTVTKMTKEDGGTPTPAGNWEFATKSEDGYVVGPAAKQNTGPDGNAAWDIQFTDPHQQTSVTIAETPQTGWTLSDLICAVNGEVRPVTVAETVTIDGVGIGDDVDCVFTNSFYVVEAAVKKEPLPGSEVRVDENGQGELVYTITVSNPDGGTTGNMPVDTGAIREAVMLPDTVSAREDVTVAFAASSDVEATGLISSISASEFKKATLGAPPKTIVLADNLKLPANKFATFTITVPIQVNATTTEQWQSLGECIVENETYKSGGVPNGVEMDTDADGDTNNMACIPVVKQIVSVMKGAQSGDAVEADADGNANLVYTVTVTNNGGSTGQIESDSGPISDEVKIPETVTPRSNITVSFTGNGGATLDGPTWNETTFEVDSFEVLAADFINGASIRIADNVNLPANSSGVFTITVPVKIAATPDGKWESLDECIQNSDGVFTSGVPNGVTMENDSDGPENNIACIPVIQRQVSVQKGPRPGGAVQANAQGEATLVYTVEVENKGGSTGDLAVDSGKITERVMLPDNVIANGDVIIVFAGGDPVIATGEFPRVIAQDAFVRNAEIDIAENVRLPANTKGAFTITVPVKVFAKSPEEWNAIGECTTDIDGGFQRGVLNGVSMNNDFDGPDNNVACIPILPQPKALITIVKEDHNATELPGAKFALYTAKLDGNGEPVGLGGIITELENISGSETRFSTAELNPGFYYLVEVQSPEGYSLLPTPIGFQLVLTRGDFSIELVDEENQLHVVQIAENLTIRVADTTSGDLPKSGSHGVTPYALLAGLILAIGLVTTRRLGVK